MTTPSSPPEATWWHQATPGTTYVRCQIPARALPGKLSKLSFKSLAPDEEGEPIVVGQEGRAAIWQFPANAVRATIMSYQQSLGNKVIVEVDDNYLHAPPGIPNSRSDWSLKLDRDGNRDLHSYAAHRKIIKWVDGVIVSTPRLAEIYARATSAPIFVCPNSIDLSDWETRYQQHEGPIRIGYAGSDSHLYDLADVDRALDWAWRSGKTLYKLGAKTVRWRWPHEQVPWADGLEDYRRNLRVLDIGLCPLRRGEWQDCKSDIKAQEYVMAGVLPIVQADAPAYADWVDVVPSAKTEKEWERVLMDVASLSRHQLEDMWAHAMSFLLERKTIERNIETWRKAIA